MLEKSVFMLFDLKLVICTPLGYRACLNSWKVQTNFNSVICVPFKEKPEQCKSFTVVKKI